MRMRETSAQLKLMSAAADIGARQGLRGEETEFLNFFLTEKQLKMS
jgi:hypothetical protein